MATITIEIPKKMLASRYGTRRLVLVEPKDLAKEAKRRWEIEDAEEASREGRKAWSEGRARLVSDLKELMK